MENKTELTSELMNEMGFWKGSYCDIWYYGEYGEINHAIPLGINIDDCEKPHYVNILGEIVFRCKYKEDLTEEFNISL